MFITAVNKKGNDCAISTEYISKCSVRATICGNNIVIHSIFVDKEGKYYKTRGYTAFAEDYILRALNVNIGEMCYYKDEIEDELNYYLNLRLTMLLNDCRVAKYSDNFDENLFMNVIENLRATRLDDDLVERNMFY